MTWRTVTGRGYSRLVARRELPIEMRLNAQPIRSSTTIARVDANTWALASTLPRHSLELHSTYLSDPHAPEVAIGRLVFTPAGNYSTTRQVPYDDLPVSESIRACLYDHLQAVQDAAHQAALGALQIDDLQPAVADVTPS